MIEGIGGDNGWYSFPLAWRVRGWLDRFSGRPGAASRPAEPSGSDGRGRARLVAGGGGRRRRLLRLRAEMRLPGLAWLELGVEEDDAAAARVPAEARCSTRADCGALVLVVGKPFHGVVFGGMQRNIARAAEEYERTGSPPRWSPSILAGSATQLTSTSSSSSSGR